MKKMTNELRKKIQTYIKNKRDVSDLIEGYSIRNENLSGAVITKLVRFNDDCRNVNLSRATLGTPKNTVKIVGCNFSNANFYKARFLGRVNANKLKAHNTNFQYCYMPYADYRNADFTDADFCHSIIRISGYYGQNAKFPKSLLKELLKGWKLT